MAAHPSASRSKPWSFSGFSFPNTTPIPDQVFDELLHLISGAELKVLLYICRRTFGFKKASDDISISQMLNGIIKRDGTRIDYGTGLSKPSLIKALKDLQEKGILIAIKQSSEERGNQATNYRLRFVETDIYKGTGEGEEPLTTRQTQIEKNFTSLGKKTLLGARAKKFTKPLVKKLYPQQTGLQETEINNNNGSTISNQDVVDVLLQEGVAGEVAKQLACLSHVTLEVVRKQIDQRNFLLETAPERVQRPTAFLVRAIQRRFPEPDGYRPKAVREAEAQALREQTEERQRHQDQLEQQVQTQLAHQYHANDQKRQVEARRMVKLQEQWGVGERDKLLWKQVLADLKGRLNSVIGCTLLENSILLSVANGNAVIALPNQWAKEYVSQRLPHLICQAFAEHLEGQKVKLQFITPESAPTSPLSIGVAMV